MELSLEFLSHENTLVHRDSEAAQGDVSSDFPAMYMAVVSGDYPGTRDYVVFVSPLRHSVLKRREVRTL